ncbi:unnamed protein product [Sphagnum balticum]
MIASFSSRGSLRSKSRLGKIRFALEHGLCFQESLQNKLNIEIRAYHSGGPAADRASSPHPVLYRFEPQTSASIASVSSTD